MSFACHAGLALIATLFIEGLIAGLWYRRWPCVAATALCNLATNPAMNALLWLIVRWLGRGAYTPALIALESGVVMIEALILRALCAWPTRRAMATSLALNAASLIGGLALGAIWTIPG